MTVFTHGTTSINPGALSSRLLATLATSVMRDGENARLEKTTLKNYCPNLSKKQWLNLFFYGYFKFLTTVIISLLLEILT